MNQLRVKPFLCNGCRSCELACAFAHVGTAPSTAPGRPRISVRAVASAHVPLLCYQCDAAACVTSCAYGALERSPRTGAIELDLHRCTRCLLCTAACPFGNIELDPTSNSVVKCDLCRGDPACAKFCPSGALAFTSV